MKNYQIFTTPFTNELKDKSTLRVDLYNDIKIKDIPQLKDFNITYITKGHDEYLHINGKRTLKKTRYIQIHQK